MPGALEGGFNGVRTTFESPWECSCRLLGFHMVFVFAWPRSPRPVRPPMLSAPVSVGSVHVEAAMFAGRPSKQIGKTARARGRGRFSLLRNIRACIIESRDVCMCVYRRVRSHRCSSRFDASRTILLAEEFLFSHFEQAFSAVVAWQDRFYGYSQSIWYSSGERNSL